ncbi:MAG: lipid-A-disaccharide synthase [Idiomarina sp.]|nr:lipid-A-disaccharide synthase [Idiomarina sp.]
MKSSDAPLLVGIVAGEKSGDILGASLMKALKSLHPNVEFVGVGGSLMIEQGLDSLFPMEQLSVMGIVDVLKNLPTLLGCRKQVVNTMLARQPAVFVGIDAPDFNLPIERKLKEAGIRTLHYVSPSVWAWRPKRIFGIAKATHNVLSILPFEEAFYQQYQVPCTFVGHPLADEIPMHSDAAEARAALGLTEIGPYVALLPGSRGSEVSMLTRPFLDAAHAIRKQVPNVRFLIAYANDLRRAQIEALMTDADRTLPIHAFDGQSRQVMAAADSCILASGTVSLEAMLIKRPMVVCYRFGWLNYHVLRHFVRVAHFSLPNLLAARSLVPELLQDQVTPEAICQRVVAHLTEPQDELMEAFSELHTTIRCEAGTQAAKVVIDQVERTSHST